MPIPAPKKRKGTEKQTALLFDERSTQEQQYDHTAVINAVRQEVDKWRALPNPSDWRVAPETARLLQYWRHHKFSNTRPFFCHVEAAETAHDAQASAEIRAQLAKTNDERRKVYATQATSTGAPIAEVGKVYGLQILQKAPAGTWLQGADGRWTQK